MICLLSNQEKEMPLMFHRIALTSTDIHKEYTAFDKKECEDFLNRLPVEWAGFIILNDKMHLSMQWLDFESTSKFLKDFFKNNHLDGYLVDLYLEQDEEAEEIKLI
jgi:hypothetical protein